MEEGGHTAGQGHPRFLPPGRGRWLLGGMGLILLLAMAGTWIVLRKAHAVPPEPADLAHVGPECVPGAGWLLDTLAGGTSQPDHGEIRLSQVQMTAHFRWMIQDRHLDVKGLTDITTQFFPGRAEIALSVDGDRFCRWMYENGPHARFHPLLGKKGRMLLELKTDTSLLGVPRIYVSSARLGKLKVPSALVRPALARLLAPLPLDDECGLNLPRSLPEIRFGEGSLLVPPSSRSGH